MYCWVAVGFSVYQYDRKEMSSFWLLCHCRKYFNSLKYLMYKYMCSKMPFRLAGFTTWQWLYCLRQWCRCQDEKLANLWWYFQSTQGMYPLLTCDDDILDVFKCLGFGVPKYFNGLFVQRNYITSRRKFSKIYLPRWAIGKWDMWSPGASITTVIWALVQYKDVVLPV